MSTNAAENKVQTMWHKLPALVAQIVALVVKG